MTLESQRGLSPGGKLQGEGGRLGKGVGVRPAHPLLSRDTDRAARGCQKRNLWPSTPGLLVGSLPGIIPGSWWEAGHASRVGFSLPWHLLPLSSSHSFH